jgi:hypothetical protein
VAPDADVHGSATMNDEKRAYLTRALKRYQDEAVSAAREGRERAMAQAAAKGRLQSGATLAEVGGEYDEAGRQATEKMLRHTYDLMGGHSAPVAEVLELALHHLRDTLSNALADFLRSPQGSWAPKNATDEVGNRFLNSMDRRITAAVDDFRFGISGGTLLSKDPVVSVITSISNSPGAVAQSGMGNVQHALTSPGGNAVRAAVAEFLNSQEVRNLSSDDLQSITDVADVLTGELDKPSPDPSKLRRWGKRLFELAERLGIAVAASGITHALFG